MRWTSGSASRSIMVLSSSVSSPEVTKSTGLPRSRERSCTSRRKRPNNESDRHHPRAHRGIAQAGGKPLDFLGDRLDRNIVGGGGQLTEAGLGDDEFADAIHQFVETFGLDADGRVGLVVRALCFFALLFGQRRRMADVGRGFRRMRIGCRHFRLQRRRQHSRRRRRLGRCKRPAIEFHFVLDKDEDVVDRGPIAIAVQRHIPFQKAVFGIEFVEKRHVLGQRHHEAGAELAEVVQQVERIGAVAKDVAVELDMKLPPDPSHRRSRRCLDRRGFDFLVSLRFDQPMQVVEDGVSNNGVGGFRRLDQGADVILGGERHRNEILIRLDLAFPHPVEGGFEFMGEARDLVEPEHRA